MTRMQPKGSMPAKWQLAFKAFSKKINTFARNSFYVVPGFTVEDMEQELLEVLWRCVFEYHPKNGATFNTLFTQSAMNRIGSLKRTANALKRRAEWVSLDQEDIGRMVEEAFLSEDTESKVLRRMMVVEEFTATYGVDELEYVIRNAGVA